MSSNIGPWKVVAGKVDAAAKTATKAITARVLPWFATTSDPATLSAAVDAAKRPERSLWTPNRLDTMFGARDPFGKSVVMLAARMRKAHGL